MLSNYEKETIIRFNEEEETAIVTTLSKKVADRYIKGGYQPEMLDIDSYSFEIPKRKLKVLQSDDTRKAFYPSGKND